MLWTPKMAIGDTHTIRNYHGYSRSFRREVSYIYVGILLLALTRCSPASPLVCQIHFLLLSGNVNTTAVSIWS